MKNLFNNLLLNSRFVFQNAGPEKPETPPPTPETGVEGVESKEASDATAGKQTEGVKSKGREVVKGTKENIIRMEEIRVIGELPPEARKQFDKISKNLGEAPGPKAREIRVAKWEAQAKNNPDAQAALDAWKNIHSPAGAKLEQVAANTQATVESNTEHVARLEATVAYNEGLRILNSLKSSYNAVAAGKIEDTLGTDAVDKMISDYNSKADGFRQAKNWAGLKEFGKQVEFNAKNLGEIANNDRNTTDDIRKSGSFLQKIVRS